MKRNHILYAIPALLLWAGLMSVASAADTAAGTDISNTATVNYKVGGVSQTAVTVMTTFETDRRVNLTVAEVGTAAGATYGANTASGYLTVGPGQTQQPILFQVTNTSNDTINVGLSFANATGTAGPHTGTDSIDTTNNLIRLDNGDSLFVLADDTAVTVLGNIPAGESRYVWVLGDIPSLAVDGALAVGTLTATAQDSGNVAFTESGSDTPGGIDTVLADGTGATDGARDGKFSASDAWLVSSATFVVTKSSTVITDPINCTTEGTPGSCTGTAKRIPGSIVEYCVDVNNSGTAAADTIVLGDPIPANTSYVAGSIRTAATGTGSACDSGTGLGEDDNNTDDSGDETNPNGADFNVTTTGAVTVRAPSIAAGVRFKALFRVKID